VRNFHLKDSSWEPRLATIAAAVERTARMDGGLVASDNFNLKPFFDRGGKLLVCPRTDGVLRQLGGGRPRLADGYDSRRSLTVCPRIVGFNLNAWTTSGRPESEPGQMSP
jgi:hypothetical protein